MSRIIHMRGDVTGMLVLFVLAFLGAWQLAVAFFRLNGLSLTGYPDRACWSKIIGAVLVAGSCAWYFSKPGHFASPDVEGIETLILLVGGLLMATVIQAMLAVITGLFWRRKAVVASETAPSVAVAIDVGGATVDALYREGAGAAGDAVPVLLLHDYGGSKDDLSLLATGLAAGGHASLAFDLAGHGDNRLDIFSPAMEELLDAASSSFEQLTGSELLAAVGVGLGGALAIDLVRRGVADRAVAIDPPARDEDGYAQVNAMRELGPLDIVTAFIKPAARAAEGRRLSLARLLRELSEPGALAESKGTVVGTTRAWLNSPEALASFATRSGLPEPVLVPGSHATIAGGEETLAAVLASLT